MKIASCEIYDFLRCVLVGICDEKEEILIEVVEQPPKTVTFVVDVHPNDAKFVIGRLKEIKIIAMSIARRHRVIVNIAVEE